jgi:hypothetical protein
LVTLVAAARLLRIKELDEAVRVLGSWSAKDSGAAI